MSRNGDPPTSKAAGIVRRTEEDILLVYQLLTEKRLIEDAGEED
jgi:hypothetical protein